MNKNHSSFIFQDDTAIVIGYCLGEYMVVATVGGGLVVSRWETQSRV